MGDCYDCLGRTVWYTFLVWLAIKLVRCLYTHLLAPTLGLGYKWRSGPDTWAIVTGSTDGIGLEYGKQLASKGYNVLLISRTQDKLDAVAASILKDCPKARKVETLAFDFTSTDYSAIESKVNSLEGTIDVLVNNVGISYVHPEYFTKLEVKAIKDLINVNVTSAIEMTRLVLPKMSAGRGVIIYLASYAGSFPTPLLAVYSATKGFVDILSRCLKLECEAKGIIVQSVLPAYVSTTMSRMRPSLMTPTAKNYVRSALSTVGIESRTYGFWAHKLLGCITETIQYLVPDAMAKMAMNSLEGQRKRAYKKYNKRDD